MPGNKLYCGFKVKEDEPIERYMSIAPSIDELFKPTVEQDKKKENEKASDEKRYDSSLFTGILEDYLEVLNGMFNSIPFVLTMLPALRQAIFKIDVFDHIAKVGKKIKSNSPDKAIYEVEDHDLPKVLQEVDKLNSITEFQIVAPKMFLTGLVAAYDGFLGRLLKQIFLLRPELISASEKRLTFAEIVRLGSIDGARDYVVEREADAILRASHADQCDTLKKIFNIDMQSEFARYLSFLEICERRNLFTHNNGIATQAYVDFCSSNGIEYVKVKVGEELNVSHTYMSTALQVFFELGVKLVHVLWRKFEKDKAAEADQSLNDIGFNLLGHRRYKLAQRILEFAVNLRGHSSEKVRLMMVVNLANAYRLGDQKDKAADILDKEDWSATSQEFRISVEAVRGDWEAAAKLVREIGPGGGVGISEYRNWPVFEGFRDSVEFMRAYQDVFKEPFDRGPSQIKIDETTDLEEVPGQAAIAN